MGSIEAFNVLHMNAGDGETSYAQNSLLQVPLLLPLYTFLYIAYTYI